MKKHIRITFLTFLIVTLGLSSCVSLKYVHDFSSSSLQSIKKYEDIDYNFKQNCLDNCYYELIKNIDFAKNKCDCNLSENADSVTFVIYNSIRGYLSGLTSLSNDELTNYKMDNLNKSLKEGDFSSININIKKEHVEAYSNISKILLKAFTDNYRASKIKEYVKEANEPIKVLIAFFQFNLEKNLNGTLNVQKEKIKIIYTDLLNDPSLSRFEKTKVLEEYLMLLAKIESKQKGILTYSKALGKIKEGHQKLFDNIESLENDEIKEQLTQYASDIQDIISEFNKLKK